VAAEDDEQLQEVEQKRATASDAIVNSDSAEKIRLVRIALENAAAHEPPPGVPTLEEVFAAGIEPASGVPIRQPGAGLEISERLGTRACVTRRRTLAAAPGRPRVRRRAPRARISTSSSSFKTKMPPLTARSYGVWRR
jgi:hypothetical protein